MSFYIKSKQMNNRINTAGGIVIKNNAILFIKKNDVWDLPKGKIKKGDKKRYTAINEISEETGLKKESLIIKNKLISTHYHKRINAHHFIKKTYWYLVEYNGSLSQKLIPDKHEGITQCKWVSYKDLEYILKDCHIWIAYLIKYFKGTRYYRDSINSTTSSNL